ncbi:MAG: helix-turn-helix domain-containing protein [Eubacteriales bacterium]|jgi:transcriptional regulator with XRE-family HTH domain
MNIGEKIKYLRKQNNISLRELAQRTGVSKTTLSDLENNAKNPSLDTLDKVARAFHMTPADLLQETDTPEDLVTSARDSSSELLAGLSKSGDLINVLYRAKDVPKETMDQMAVFLDTLLKTQGYSRPDDK